MSEGKRTEFFQVRKAPADRFTVVARRRIVTIEGKLVGSPWTKPLPLTIATLTLVAIGELLTLLGPAWAGISMHSATLLGMVTLGALLRRVHPTYARLLIALAPVPLIRIVSLASPLSRFSYIQWFTILAIIVYAGVVAAIKILKPDLRTIGLRLPEKRHWPLEIAIALAGFALGWIEFQILHPNPLVAELNVRTLAAPILVLYVSTGLLEEIIFRGLLQRYAGEAMGVLPGIVFVTALFAILHIGWDSWLDIFFVAGVGALFAAVVHRTKSILGVSIAHGITNSMLFLIMPLLAQA